MSLETRGARSSLNYRPDPSQRPLLFLDFEASSLTPRSWPVEIGFAWIDRDRVRLRSMLIAPRPDWSMADWSDASAQVHGLGVSAVRGGRPADLVAAQTDRFAGCEVVSDNPVWDQRWLDRLREGREGRIEVTSLRDAMAARLDGRAADALCRSLFLSAAPHRAGPDAERLAQAWLEAAQARGIAA